MAINSWKINILAGLVALCLSLASVDCGEGECLSAFAHPWLIKAAHSSSLLLVNSLIIVSTKIFILCYFLS